MQSQLRSWLRLDKRVVRQNRRKFRLAVEALEDRITPSGAPFVEPTVIHSVNGVLTATLTEQIGTAKLDNQTITNAWTYNGLLPGPTLEANPGDLLDITIVNKLGEPTNLHTHGLDVSPVGNADNILLSIEPGQSNRYLIRIPTNTPNGLDWYHPHVHMFTYDQVYLGLSGMLVIGQPDGGAPQLAGLPQHLIALQNFAVSGNKLFVPPPPGSAAAHAAETFTVNGQVNPVLTMAPGEVDVFNVANMSSDATYTLVMVDTTNPTKNINFLVTDADGNPTQTAASPQKTPPQELQLLAFPTGRRFSFIVDGSKAKAGDVWQLQTIGYEPNDPTNIWPGATTPITLMTIQFQGPAVSSPTIAPGTPLTPPNNNYVDLRKFPQSQIAAHRTVVLSKNGDEELVNGGQFPNNVVFQPQLGTVEEWTLVNNSPEDHPFHLHTNPMQIISGSGPTGAKGIDPATGLPFAQPAGLDLYYDIVLVPTGRTTVVRIWFNSFTGDMVYHCHRLDHEDMGMMGLVDILPAQPILVTGAGPGGTSLVTVRDSNTNAILGQFNAWDPSFSGGVTVTTGDVNGDGYSDIIVGAGPGGGPEVKVYDGKDFHLMYDLFAYKFGFFFGGVNVAAGDVDGDGKADIIVGAGPGAGSEVKVFSGADGSLIRDFFAFAPSFHGGVTVACADIQGNGRFEIIVGAGPGGGPLVNVYDAYDPTTPVLDSFYAFAPSFTGGVNVSTGRVRGIAFDSILCGAGPGGGPQVTAFTIDTKHIYDMSPPDAADDAFGLEMTSNFFAFPQSYTGGVRIGSLNRSLGTNFLISAGSGSSQVSALDGVTQAAASSFFALPPTFVGGMYVAGN